MKEASRMAGWLLASGDDRTIAPERRCDQKS